jgi:homocitrate synthase NifV
MVKIVDTTLRDGEQMAGIAWNCFEKIKIAVLLDQLGVHQIEAGIPAMGGDEVFAIQKMVEMKRSCLISTWNRLNEMDLTVSMLLSPDIIHISIPSSDLQMREKLKKSRSWVLDCARDLVGLTASKGYRVTVGLEDASRADLEFLTELSIAVVESGAERIRYADTVGVLNRSRIYSEMRHLIKNTGCEWEIHTHNDLGMAVTNSLSAVKAGVRFVDTTLGGIGERAGNCNWRHFIEAYNSCAVEGEDEPMPLNHMILKDMQRFFKVGCL